MAFEGGNSQIDYEPKPDHPNSFGVTHGAARLALFDVCLATAARRLPQDLGVVHIE